MIIENKQTNFNLDIDKWNALQETNSMMHSAVSILDIISNRGYQAFIVGGSVRDIIMNREINDIDITTNMPMKVLELIFKTHDIGKSKDFGILNVKFDDFDFEIAQFRTEQNYTNGRHPEDVQFTTSFKNDCNRRDFTINTMGIDKEGNIVDFFNGINDIKDNILRCVGDTKERMNEDYLRMLRAIRFAARFNFEIDLELKNVISENADKILDISQERITQEIYKSAKDGGKALAKFIEICKDLQILRFILPEIDVMDNFLHSPEHHPEGNVLDHTLAVLRQSDEKDPLLNLSLLFHDIGKIRTHEIDSEGYHRYNNHDNVGVKLFEEIVCPRMKISNKDKEIISFCIKNHMKYRLILEMKNSKIIRLKNDPSFEMLKKVSFFDSASRGRDDTELFDEINKKIENININLKPSEYEELRKNINGHKVMELTGLKPSKELGILIDETLEWALDNNVKDSEKLYNFIRRKYE